MSTKKTPPVKNQSDGKHIQKHSTSFNAVPSVIKLRFGNWVEWDESLLGYIRVTYPHLETEYSTGVATFSKEFIASESDILDGMAWSI
jgi:hypothetical protein